MTQVNGDKIFFNSTPPLNGMIIQSGGIVSPWYAFVINFDVLMVQKYTNKDRTLVAQMAITQQEIETYKNLGIQAIRENFINKLPSADVDFILSLSMPELGVTKTETFGPVSDGSLGAIVSQLNKLDFG